MRAAIQVVAVLAASLFTSAGLFAAEPTAKFDWTHWKSVPVMHNGRIMPMDTFARSAVQTVSGREKFSIDLADYFTPDELAADNMAAVRKLFPAEGARRFDPSELLWSWIQDSEAWEDIPCLHAEHDKLRELLGVPVTGPKGTHLKYVSPAQVRAADKFQQYLFELSARRRRTADDKEVDPETASLDTKADDLFQSFALFKSLQMDQTLDQTASARFQTKLEALVMLWQEVSPKLQLFGEASPAGPLNQRFVAARTQLQAVAEALQASEVSRITDLEPPLAALVGEADELLKAVNGLREQLESASAPSDTTAGQLQRVKLEMQLTTQQVEAFAQAALESYQSLFENRKPIRVMPALSVEALEKERQVDDEAHAWLDLESLLTAPAMALQGFPSRDVDVIRSAFLGMSKAYKDGNAAEFTTQSSAFLNNLQEMGERMEPIRRRLPVKDRDELLFQYTAYPPRGQVARELRYNALDPFKWTWIVSLLGLICYALAFGKMQRLMFWLGTALCLAAIGWSIYGFVLRVAITEWAPVTNMYETVVYVPLVIAILGMVFAFLPLSKDTTAWFWRAQSIPQLAKPPTWNEAANLNEVQREASTATRVLLIGVRLFLMAAGFWFLTLYDWYNHGGEHKALFPLVPRAGVGNSMPDLNDLVVWLVGLGMVLLSLWALPKAIVAVTCGLVAAPFRFRANTEKLMPLLYAQRPFLLAGSMVSTFLWMAAWYASAQDVQGFEAKFNPLTPVLRDNFWLTIHVLTIVSSYGAGLLSLGLADIGLFYFLFGKYRPVTSSPEGTASKTPTAESPVETVSVRPPENAIILAGYTYKAMQVATVLLAAGTILGGLWADVSWGRFWGWDPKEVWALISFMVYLVILHGRFAGWLNHFGVMAGAVVAACAIAFSWYGVNFVLGAGLHAYGFGESKQGQLYIAAIVIAHAMYVAYAGLRYSSMVREMTPQVPVSADAVGGMA